MLMYSPSAQDADLALCRCEGGVEMALQYAKMWCRYAKDLLAWMDKRITLEQEFAKNIMKAAEGAKPCVAQQDMMPLQYIYTMALEQDVKNSTAARQTTDLIQQHCYQALAAKKYEIDKWRREFKEQWAKEQKRMNDAVASLKKARQQYVQRCEELEKAKAVTAKAADDTSGFKTLDKRRRSKEEAQYKVTESETLYRQCVSDARIHQDELLKVKERIISHTRKLICQGDTVLKEATVNMFYYQRQQTEQVPLGFHNLELTCRPLEPGEPYLLYILSKRRQEQPPQVFTFQEFLPPGGKGGKRKNTLSSLPDSTALPENILNRRSHDSRRTGYIDGDSIGGSLESLTSPAHGNRRLRKAPSTGTMSSEDLDDRDMATVSESDCMDSATEGNGALGKARMPSRAALTHRLRKMKSKMVKCKQCDTYIVVNGIECEECGLALHRKCMEVCQLECEHRKGILFGVGLSLLPRDRTDHVPFVVQRCTAEIESRALTVQGVYRVSGSKPRIQKLCQAFEIQREQLDLSDLSPHDITSVLKHFFKELPEPLLTFDLYNDFISMGKAIQALSEKQHTAETPGKVTGVVHNLRELLERLPPCRYTTLQHMMMHLHRVSENFEENKMSPGNLGIVFGPTLLRPLVSVDMSMIALLETSYQALLIEFLITHHEQVFGVWQGTRTPPPPAPTAPLPDTPPRAPCPLDRDTPPRPSSLVNDASAAAQDRGASSRERPRSLESRAFKRDSSEGYISDKSSSNEAVDQISPEANERAVLAVRGAVGAPGGGRPPAGEPDPPPHVGTRAPHHFTRQPVKNHRFANPGTRLRSPGAGTTPPRPEAWVAGTPEERTRTGSAGSSHSSSPEPGAQRRPPMPDATRQDVTRQDVPPVRAAQQQQQHAPGPDVASGGEGARGRANLNTNQSNNGQSGVAQGRGPCQSPRRRPVDQALTAPAQKILSGLKLRRNHSGKDEQLFV